jgi:phosphoglycerate dehydrogenase-like enzyme
VTHCVFVMERRPEAHRKIILAEQPPGFRTIWQESDDPNEVIASIAKADFLISPGITAQQLAQAHKVKLIQMLGVGYDRIDVDAAQARGIPVAISPDGTSSGVAEHTLLLILALYKRLIDAHNALAEGRWIRADMRSTCLMLEGKRAGIVGFGRIGREVAKRLRAFGAEVVYNDVARAPQAEEDALGVTYLDLDDLLASSDIVTLHVFLAPGSCNLIGRREIEAMKPGAALINTCRGGVVDEAAVYDALESGRLYGAGIDVFAEEPVALDHPFLKLRNVVLTPHMAAHNRDTLAVKARACYANFERVLRGEEPVNVVRPYAEVLAQAKAG